MSPKSPSKKLGKNKTVQGTKGKLLQMLEKPGGGKNASSKTNSIDDQNEIPVQNIFGEEDLNEDQIILNANMVTEALKNEDKALLADRIGKLIDYCNRLKADLDKQNVTNEELLSKIENADQRFKQTLNVSLVSEDSIQKLQTALENAWRKIDASHLREQALQEKKNEMHKKMMELEGKAKKTKTHSSDNMAEIADISPISNKRDSILRERDRLQLEVDELEKRLQAQRKYSENIEKLKKNAETANKTLVQELESDATEKNQLERKIQDLNFIWEKSTDTNLMLTQKIELIESQNENLLKQIVQKTQDMQYVQTQYEKLKKDQASWSRSLMKRSIALNSCIQKNKSLTEQLRNALNILQEKESEIKEAKRNCKKSAVNLDSLASRQNKMSQIRAQLSDEILILKNDINYLEKQCTENVRSIEAEKREKETIIRERNSLSHSMLNLNKSIKDLDHSLFRKNNTIEKLQDDIIKKGLKCDELKDNMDMTVMERDRKAQEINTLNKKVDSLEDSVSRKTEQNASLTNAVNEMTMKYMKTKKLLESANSKELKLHQELQAFVKEKENTKSRLAHLNHQVTQLKEEIANYEKTKLTLNLNLEKMSKENQKLKIEAQHKSNLLNNIRDELNESKKENENLQKTSSDCEKRLTKESTKLDGALREKDSLGSQLIGRNNEILLLKEKISIFENTIRRGEMHYKQRIEDIRLLKIEIMKLRSQRNTLTRSLTNTADMRQEVVKVHRVLLQERIMNSALQEEIATPVNVHRWRRLGGQDPERMELIRKIIELQKQTLKLQENLSKREQQVHQSNELYCLLRNYIEKLPSSEEVKSKLVESQRLLRSRSRKLKALTAELNARHFEIEACDCTVEGLKIN